MPLLPFISIAQEFEIKSKGIQQVRVASQSVSGVLCSTNDPILIRKGSDFDVGGDDDSDVADDYDEQLNTAC